MPTRRVAPDLTARCAVRLLGLGSARPWLWIRGWQGCSQRLGLCGSVSVRGGAMDACDARILSDISVKGPSLIRWAEEKAGLCSELERALLSTCSAEIPPTETILVIRILSLPRFTLTV
eukprot:5477561-Pyramimonas_sp.AAC.1